MEIVIICENQSSFLADRLAETLRGEFHKVTTISPKVNLLKDIKSPPDLFFLYSGSYLKGDKNEFLVYLRDYCSEKSRRIGIIGYPDDISELEQFFPGRILWEHFVRPFDMKELVARLRMSTVNGKIVIGKKHILLVDDNGSTLRNLSEWLSREYDVSMAGSAAMAIKFLASNRPDLILLDYEMPVCSGPQFLEMIHSEPETADIPVMFLTARSDMQSVITAMSLKPAGYLLKSMDMKEILNSIRNFFAE